MSEQTRELVLQLRRRLRQVIRRITLAEMAFGACLFFGVVAAYWIGSVALEAGFWLSVTPRALLFWGGVLLAAGLFGYFILLPVLRLIGWLKGPTEEEVALEIGARFPEVSDRLVNVLHLADGRHSSAPPPLVDRAVRTLAEEVQAVPLERVETFERVRRAARLASAPLLGLLVFLIAAPSTFIDASKRLLTPGVAYERAAPFSFLIEPGSAEVVKGATIEVAVRLEGTVLPSTVTLALNRPGEEARELIPLAPDSSGTFRHTLVNVRRTLRYRVEAAGVMSPWYTLSVTERPLVRGLQLQLTYPAYTRIPPQRLAPNLGDVTALPGTRVDVTVEIEGEAVEEAFLRFDDGTLDTLHLEPQRATGTFTLSNEGTYHVLLRNARGIENSDPIAYRLKLLEDAYPAILLLAPPPEAELNERLTPGLRLRIADDFGFARLRLFYRLAESRFGQPEAGYQSLDLPLTDRRTLDQEIEYAWDLRATTPLDPVPGDVIEYYVAVWDNDAVAGYKAAQTPPHRLRFPSLAEQYERLHDQEDQVEESIESISEEAEDIQRQFEELREELRRKPEADWEDQRQLEQLQERQQQLEQRVDDLTNQIEEVTSQMEENNLVRDETLEMFRELQEVAEEINTPELMEALRQLQEAMQNMNLQQMQQALENFEFNEEQYQQRLERTLELFKQLRVQQGLEEIARRAEALARQEERLAEETGKLLDEQAPEEAKDPSEEEAEQAEPQGEKEASETDPERTGDPSEQNEQQTSDEQEQGETPEGPQQGEPRDAEQLAREQERAAEEMQALEEQMKKLQEQMEEVRNAPKQEMQQLNQQMQQQNLSKEMQRNAEQLRQNELQPAQQGQQQMQQQLQQMQQQLQQMQENMQGQQMQLNLSGLRRALSDILTLSQQQETLRSEVRGLAADSPELRRFAQEQVELSEGLSVVTDSLHALARNIPQMTREVQRHAGEALREMGAATSAMAERVARRASGHQKGAMTHLNELALLLSDLLNQMMNSMSGSSSNMSMQQMIQQLQQMAGQQQQLNQQIQQLLNDMQGNRLTRDMQERLRQLAGQQEQIRNQLKQFSRNREFKNEILGDLNKIAEQMDETIRELQQQRTSRRTLERQQQILTRLLDATRSLQERGKEKRREARTGEDVQREGPGALTPREAAEKLRRDLLRALESGYAPDYEELIKRYFELLQQRSQEGTN